MARKDRWMIWTRGMCATWLAVALAIFALPCPAGDDDPDWQAVPIPQTWTNPPAGPLSAREGFAWYRCLVIPPPSWEEEDELTLFVEAVDDAREIYINGQFLGNLGTMPPEYRSGLGLSLRFSVPKQHVLFGEQNVIAIRVFRSYGRSGFNVTPPVLFGGTEAIQLDGTWEAAAGDDDQWARLSARHEITDEAVFSETTDAEIVEQTLRRLDDEEGPLSLEESLARFQTPDDLAIDLVAGEPEVRQPLSMKFDHRGRMWVVQYLQYPDPAGLKMVSRDRHLRTVYDKVPPAPPNHFRGADKITIHEDTTGDGRFDHHQTFVDGLSIVSSFAIGRGGVWVLNPPYLLFYPDRDGDGAADDDPEVHLEGFGLEDTHAVANSLHWGPDGWLYGAQGSTVTGQIKRPGSDDPPVHSMGQLIWRYHPETRQYEIFAEGGGNAFGMEIDSKGRIYSGHNGGNTRGFHYVQGGYYQKGFGKHGDLSNPFTYGYFPYMSHHDVPRFTHDFVIYEDQALPPTYHGRLFGLGPLQGHVVMSEIEPEGSSFQTRDIGHPIDTDDTWFRPVEIQVGPDGALYVLDFYEQRIDHASHFQGRVHRDGGRIYRIRGKEHPPFQPKDLSELSSHELVDLLRTGNRWHRQTALRLLGDRRDETLIPHLKQILEERTGQFALEALWALNLSGGFDEATGLRLLDHRDPHVRRWTVRLLCDGQISDAAAGRLRSLAERESDLETRSQLASSARRLPAHQAMPIVGQLLRHDQDAGDIHIPLLLWWAIEDKAGEDRDEILELFADASLWHQPLVRNHITERLMRRWAATGTRRDLLTCARLLELAPAQEDVQQLLAGFERAFEGRSLGNLPDELLAAMADAGGGSLALRLRRGEEEAVAEAMELIADHQADVEQRVPLIRILGDVQWDEAVEPLLDLLEQSSEAEIQAAALTALQTYRDPQIGRAVLQRYDRVQDEARSVAQTLLASRAVWSRQLVDAVAAGDIPAESVSGSVVQQMLLHGDEQLVADIGAHWQHVDTADSQQMQEAIERYSQVLLTGSGNPYRGKELYMEHCGKCHRLFGEGGDIGPDLTSYQRDDMHGMVMRVVNPSVDIREGYETYVVMTEDGRALSGFIADQDSQVVVLQGVDGQSIVIPRDQIEEKLATPRSLMPERLLDPLSDQQVRDLFAYLRSAQPVN